MTVSTECPGCGSTPSDRDEHCANNLGNTTDLRPCPHCFTMKCCMCDMGDNVGCITCDQDDPEEIHNGNTF